MRTICLILFITLGTIGKLFSQTITISGNTNPAAGAQEYYEASFDYYVYPVTNFTWVVNGGYIISQSTNPTQTVWVIIQWNNTPGYGYVGLSDDIYSISGELPTTIAEGCHMANAGSSITICSGSSTIIGAPAISGYSYSWSPSTGLNNATIAQPTASPSTTTNYTLTMTPSNLFINGDFESGLTGFDTDYGIYPTSNSTICNGGGRIIVTTNPNSLGIPQWCSKTDHSPIGDKMLAIDGSCQASDRIWYQTVTVASNTDYYFSGWACPNGYDYGEIQYVPIIRVRINGVDVIQNFSVLWDPLGCSNWQNFSTTWNSGPSTSATIEIFDDNLNPSGNDFSIDDLFFTNCPTSTDEVTINVENTPPAVSPAGPITYYNQYESVNYVILTSTSSENYQWYKNNVAINGATNQSYTITISGLFTATDYYKCVNSCGSSNTVTFNYVGCDDDNDYPVYNPWTICASLYPRTLSQPNLGTGTTYFWSSDYSCYTLSNFSGNTCQADIVCSPYYYSAAIYTRALSSSGAETRMCFGIYANESCRTLNPLIPIINPKNTIEQKPKNINPGNTRKIPENIKIIPNPANSILTIISQVGILQVDIYSMSGESIKRIKTNQLHSLVIPVQDISSGIYSCKVVTQTGIEYIKLLIQR